MVSSSTSTPAVDADFVDFIKEFLFNPSPRQDSSARSVLRHQRTPPRHKRSRVLWRAAATSFMKKRYSSQNTHLPPFADHLLEGLPSQVAIDNGTSSKEDHLHSSQTTHLPSAQQLHRGLPPSEFSLNSADKQLKNFPLEVSVDDGHASQATHSSSADQLFRNLPSHIFLDDGHGSHAIDSLSTDQFPGGDGLTTIDSQHHKHTRVDIDALKEAPLVTPACLNSTRKGSSRGCYSKVQHLEAPPTPNVPKRSSRKPPRPPRSTLSRSGSYRAIRLKNASRRAIVDNVRMRKQKSLKSSPNATPMWALIVTLCFVIIMLVQGFLGSNSKELDSRAKGQSVGEGIPSQSSYSGVPPSSSERTTQAFVLEHEDASSLEQLQQKKQIDSLFVTLRRRWFRKLGATSWLLS